MAEKKGISSGALRFRQPATVDKKGRVVMQQEYRLKYGPSVWMLIEDGGLTVLTPEQFEMLARHVMRRTSFFTDDTADQFFHKGLRRMREKFFANATELEFDQENRLTIPKLMRDAAGMALETPVVWLAQEDFMRLRRAVDVAADDANDCVQRDGAAGNPALTVAPPFTPPAPESGF